MNLGTILTGRRDVLDIEGAIKRHDRTGLALAISAAVSLVMALLGGSKYAPLIAAFADPNTVAAVGGVVAAVIAGFGHWSVRGALADVAVVASDGAPGGPSASPQGPLDPQPRSQPADTGTSDAVRSGAGPVAQPTTDWQPGGPVRDVG